MAFLVDVKVFLCIVLISCYVTVTLQQVPIDCCLETSSKSIEKRNMVDYIEQKSGEGCAIDATIMVTRRGMKLCMPASGSWVTAVKIHVDQLRKKCKKNNFKHGQCVGVRRA